MGLDSRRTPLDRAGRISSTAATDAGSPPPHVSMLLAGVVEPDFNRVVSHKIHIIALRPTPPPPRSGVADAFMRFAKNAEEVLRLGRGLEDVSFVLGQATHFVQDLNQPLHAAWGETRAEHNEVEVQMLYRCWQKDHTYRGFMLVKNYSCFAYDVAQNSSQHARALFFDREIKRVTETAWDQAVSDTANLWQSIFWNALGPERAWQEYGIPTPVMDPFADRPDQRGQYCGLNITCPRCLWPRVTPLDAELGPPNSSVRFSREHPRLERGMASLVYPRGQT